MALELLRASMKKEKNPGELKERMKDIIPMVLSSIEHKKNG